MARRPLTSKQKKQKAERRRRWRAKKHVERYGPNAGDQRGKHGNSPKGPDNPRWNPEARLVTSHGYIAVRVPLGHPHGWGNGKYFKYAYEHILIAEKKIGRPLTDDEIVHHRNKNKHDNDPTNLRVMTSAEHAALHLDERGRDELGRFPPSDKHVELLP